MSINISVCAYTLKYVSPKVPESHAHVFESIFELYSNSYSKRIIFGKFSRQDCGLPDALELRACY